MTQFSNALTPNSSNAENAPRFSKMIRPLLAATAVGFVVAGCTPSTTVPTGADGDEMMSSSVAAMMFSSEAMMEASSSSVAAAASAYQNGTFSATGDYTSPAGAEHVDVTLTIANGVIVDSTFVGQAVNPVSKMRQQAFSEGYKELVVGKSIDEVSLSVVNGSSLAPKGFMDAVAKIKAEAKA